MSRKINPNYYALKGGVNLRFFCNSFRYSEDMDIDIHTIEVGALRDVVMKILQSVFFQDNLKTFGIERIIPPDITKAKQTQTTQRFKVHLITPASEDLFTKVEFSRRGFKGEVIVQSVLTPISRLYKTPPLIIPHYNLQSAAFHKIEALSSRVMIQARDIFDLYILTSQYKPLLLTGSRGNEEGIKISESQFKKAYENVFEVDFKQFRDTVISYLTAEDQSVYDSSSLWDEIKLKVANYIEEIRGACV
ncbi:MAG: nucleotidyl transferase AbiEii/AbiGii toxin family protein [Candidatus Omnitrophica bacterium]|nr:nucleotidyl transferase AbiEii/AbiGii toxin family protein [Candidatus Omnitrophota bacterium]